MPPGLSSNFVVYDNQVQTNFVLTVIQNIIAFNAASAGALIMRTELLKGDIAQDAIFDSLDPIARRDITVNTAVADQIITQSEDVSVKLNRRVGPVAMADDAFRKIQRDPSLLGSLVANWAAAFSMKEQLNEMIAILVSILEADGATTNDISLSGSPQASYNALNETNALLGDASENIICYIMHSNTWHKLIAESIAGAITNVADLAIKTGELPGSLGRRVIVTDSPFLFEAGAPNRYKTLALVANAGEVIFSENSTFKMQDVLGLENLSNRVQGDYAYNAAIRGHAYDVATGGINPDDTAVQLATNWNPIGTDVRQRAGAILVSAA